MKIQGNLVNVSLTLALILSLVLASTAGAQESEEQAEETEKEEEKDPNRGRFLALPFIITEPAIGEGIGGGLIYFHEKPDDPIKRKVTSGKNIAATGKHGKPPPTATGLFAMYTNTETYAYGLGHSGSSPTDKYRYIGAAAAMNINATVYLGDFPVKFNMDGRVLYLHGKRRWKDSNIFIGASASYLDSTTKFKTDNPVIQPLTPDFSATDVGVALSVIYDGRDDTMMPSSGQLYDLTVWNYGGALGGDFDYTTARFKFNMFHRLGEKFVLGYRFDFSTASGDVPYYSEPYVSIRGIPALRYTGENVAVIEVEGRYDFAKRWSGVAFAGLGFVDETELSQSEDDIYGYGVGIRFQALKEQNIWLGVDLAQGPEDKAWYVQMGHAW
ncbi:MAG: outer membrane protein assembly factor BamA [Woeseiaceae bacterium]|jgi:outer membrane protein assembly factor BamA